ncbi:MAG: TRAP transporter small permease [Clostridiales Family XIII bacterium]|jgi:TRAP-type C4-dicarboxylate transport system permease small subunit|nr:TRAP transporter small permease [Clostridiales Family XIII bacterium]
MIIRRMLTDRLNNIESICVGIMIAVAVVVIFMQIIMRYVFNNSLSWSEELARYLFIWFSWLGVSIGQRNGEHISVTLLTDRLKPAPQKVVIFIKDIITLLILLVLVYYGVVVVGKQISMGVVSVALKIPMYVIYFSMPLGCLLMAIRVVAGFFKKRDEVTADPAQVEGGE